jgi:predicted ATPase
MLVLASVLGPEFSTEALRRVDHSSRDPLDLVAEAEGAGLVKPVTGQPGRFRFAHDLIRQTFYGDLGATRRMELHRRTAEALEDLYGRDAAPHLAELAHHFFEAAAGGGATEPAVDYARRAGDQAADSLAYEDAVQLYRGPVDRAADVPARRGDRAPDRRGEPPRPRSARLRRPIRVDPGRHRRASGADAPGRAGPPRR